MKPFIKNLTWQVLQILSGLLFLLLLSLLIRFLPQHLLCQALKSLVH